MAQSQSVIDIKLNVGNAISDAHALEDAFKSVGKAMEQATIAGDSTSAKNYGQLQGMLRDQYRKMMEQDNPGTKTTQNTSLVRGIRGVNALINGGTNAIGAAGGGNAAGAALGVAANGAQLAGTLGVSTSVLAAAGVAAALIGLVAGANKLSEQWEKVMQPSMALTASLGNLSNSAEKNSLEFQNSFSRATARNTLHGYTNEEGIALANQLAKMGANNVFGGEEQVFRYQRDTDADRNTLTQAVGLSQRYRGGENALGYAYGGLQESGMKPGQYQEYLNATLRIFEEGLSRGVVKGFGEITRTQNMLSQIGETWKGEQGAQRYQQMSDVVSGAGKLESDYDVVLYKAMQDVMTTAANGSKGDAGSYIDVKMQLDKGLNPELLDAAMKRMYQASGSSREETITQSEQMWNLSTTAAAELFDAWKGGDLRGATDKVLDPDSRGAESTETKLLGATQQIAANVALIGTEFLPAKTAILDGISRLTNVMAGERAFQSYKGTNRDTMQGLGFTDSETNRVNRLFNDAYTKKDQPDSNENMMGDYGENAMEMQRALENLPTGIKYKIAMDPALQRQLFSGVRRVEDFTPERLEEFNKRISEIEPLPFISAGSAKGYRIGSQHNNSFNEAIDRGDPYAMAYAQSVKERWSGRMPEYRESEEYSTVDDYIRRKGRDGLTSAEIQEMVREAIQRSSQQRTQVEDNDQEMKGQYTNDIMQRVQDPRNPEYSEFMDLLNGNYQQLSFSQIKGVAEPAMGRNSEMGGFITQNELADMVRAMRELIRTLGTDSTTTVEIP